MRIVITGASGQLGYELQAIAPEQYHIIPLMREQLDLTQTATILPAITALRPDVIINAAAYTAVDSAETATALVWLLNVEAAGELARAARETGARFIHISTDFVFDGKKSSPYLPQDKPDPLNIYGHSKWRGEQKVLAEMPWALIIRTGWLYSVHGKNFVKTMLQLLQKQDCLKVVVDQIGTPTWARNLARAVWAAVKDRGLAGIYHWSDAGIASWYDFAVAIQEESLKLKLITQPKPVYAITTAEFPVAAPRPAYSVLDKTATCRDFNLPLQHWREALRAMLTELATLQAQV